MKLGAKQAEQVQKFVPRSRVRIFRNKHSRSTPLDLELTFWCVSYYLAAFGAVWLPYEARCKTCRTSAKVGATKSRRNFSQRTHPIHPIMHPIPPLDPKLMFWCVLYYFIAFGTVWLHYETRCIMGRTSAKVRATKSRRNFSEQKLPIHPIGP